MRGCRILTKVAGVLSLAGAVVSAAAAAPESRRELIFGVEPAGSERAQTMIWLPLLEHLSIQLGLPVRLATVNDRQSFDACLKSGFYDIVFMNPYHYITANNRDGYRAIARQGDERVQGLLVVGHDSPIKSLDDLTGQTAAFSTPYSFADSILVQSAIDDAGVTVSPVFFQSQAAVYSAVSQGSIAVGGGTPDSFTTLDAPIRSALRILHVTQDVTPNAFAVHTSLSIDLRTRILDVLATVGDHAPEALDDLSIGAIVPARDADWDKLRAMSIDPPRENTVQCPFTEQRKRR